MSFYIDTGLGFKYTRAIIRNAIQVLQCNTVDLFTIGSAKKKKKKSEKQ